MTGHVFVIQGDTRRLACDAYLHATDKRLRPDGGWTDSAPDAANRLDPKYESDFRSEVRYTLPLLDRPGHEKEPRTILTAVPYYGMSTADEIVPRLEEFFRVGAEISRRRSVTRGLRPDKRYKPLLAVPLFGASGGGGGAFRGQLLRVIDEQSRIAADKHDLDVVIVLRDPQAYALAQTIRKARPERWAELDERLLGKAQDLGAIARDARLVPFMGSGISMSAGAPDWKGLISHLASEAGLDDGIIRSLVKNYDALDQAAYVRQALSPSSGDDKAFKSAIVRAVDKRRYGLAPPLLAALEAEQAITLNYDRLFEWAAHDGQRPRRVIPGSDNGDGRWLLKLHGSAEDPDSIVLTREDYLGFNTDRAALSSLVKATLMTRHLLFVGFGMGDPHFHEIVHDVRRALPEKKHHFGTVLTLQEDEVMKRLWSDDLDFVALETPRKLEIFLDAMLAYGSTSNSYLLGDGYESALSEADVTLRDALMHVAEVGAGARGSSAWPVVERMLRELGHEQLAPSRSWGPLPAELD